MKHPSEDLICYALLRDPNLVLTLKRITPKMLKVVQEVYPDFTIAFPDKKK